MRWWRVPDRNSLAWRLSVGFVAAFISLAAVYAGVQIVLAERFSGLITRQSMAGQAEDIFDGLRFDANGIVNKVHLEGAQAFGFDAFFANLKYRVLDAQGRVVASSEARRDSLLPDVPLAQQDGFYEVRALDGVPFHLAAWHHTARGQPYVVQLGRSDGFAELAREAISPAVLETVGLLATLSAIVFAVVGARAIRGVLKPIRAAVQSAGQVGEGNLSARLPEAGMPSEIRPLLAEFNAVLERLQQAFGEQQRFFANAAHELKTPLALMRSQLDQPGAADTSTLLAQVDAMGRRVQQLLLMAETADRTRLRKQRLAMGEALDGAVRYLAWKAERRGVVLQFVEPAEVVWQEADAGAVFVLVKNLLENAIDFTPTGGSVTLVLTATGFRVDDEGPGVPPEHRLLVFERFWRTTTHGREGAGLGLALCHEVAQAHGWRIACSESEPGGARFEVSFGALEAE